MKIFRLLILSLFTGVLMTSGKNFAATETKTESAFHPPAVRQGLYTSMTTGRVFFTGTDRTLYKDGWVVGWKLGYDIWKYFGLESQFKLSGHPSTTKTNLANIPRSFFVFQFIAVAKGMYPITERLHVELGVGGGLFSSSPNQNSNSSANRGMFYTEFGLEYFMRTRGISVGLDPSIAGVQNMKGAIIQTTGFVRYTF